MAVSLGLLDLGIHLLINAGLDFIHQLHLSIDFRDTKLDVVELSLRGVNSLVGGLAHGRNVVALGHNGSECTIVYADEPIDDPTFTCWLDPESDSLDDYICMQDHPCLDMNDGDDHGDDSY